MKVAISNNLHLSPDDDDDDDDVSFSPQNGNRPFPCLETSRSDSDSTWRPSEVQEHEQASLSECFFHKKGKEGNNRNSCYQKSPAMNKPLNGGEALIGGSISDCIHHPLKSDLLFFSSQETVRPNLPRNQINLSSVSNNSSEYQQRSCRVPLSGFRQSPPPCLPPFPFVRIPYGSYCPAQSNQNYYRRVIFRPHPHGEHEASLGRGFNRPPPQPLPYVVSPHSYQPPVHFVPGPLSPLSPPPLPTQPPALTVLVVKQIDHYFSEENLETDYHLKSLMDDQGWVHVDEIVKFPRVWNLTHNITLILKSLIARSKVVEVKDKCIRRKNGWEKWIKRSDDQASNNN